MKSISYSFNFIAYVSEDAEDEEDQRLEAAKYLKTLIASLYEDGISDRLEEYDRE